MLSIRPSVICISLLSAVVLATIGCGRSGPETARVSGVVTLNAKPVAGASVMLVPEAGGRRAHAVTDERGAFELTTFESGDGVVLGRHAVSVSKKKTTGIQADADGLSGPVAAGGLRDEWLLPKRYANPKTSGLTCEITGAKDDLLLELTDDR